MIFDQQHNAFGLARLQFAFDQGVNQAAAAAVADVALLLFGFEDCRDVPDARFVLELEAERRLTNRDDVAMAQLGFDDALVVHERPVRAVHVEDMIDGADILDLTVGRRHFVVVDDDVAFFAAKDGRIPTELDGFVRAVAGERIEHAAFFSRCWFLFLHHGLFGHTKDKVYFCSRASAGVINWMEVTRMPTATQDQAQPVDFAGLILGFSSAALYYMGEGVIDGKAGQKNLPLAKQNIDIIDLLKVKSKNNLSPDEHELIEQLLADLHLKFVEIANK